ncbi:peptidoglycan DD-metalloendopeptidase family protein [Methylocystis sp. B8]|uniref:peptidoglycan DD-metalloendopeptidase family protein n=1 Tax=Methylocystis sp. B8 TaxID=544938 RepID=UPI0010FECB64|nr:peptidoglycan DD-metalloendopeptidase family protein [Methylocystis sp. B8]TLG75137.1 LysM peptidoglycan-binding domain-containing protein [Methylocystis sp. B8]
MAIKRPFAYSRAAGRFLAAAGVAALAGCSDASRFAGDPFSDPFSNGVKTASRGVDRAPVGAIASAPAQSAPSTAVESRPLPAPNASASAPAAGAASSAHAPAPAATSPGRVAAASGNGHWSAEGGTPIVVAQGETAALLATRYGVPADALLRTNGFNAASQVQPGSRLVIPVYRAGAAPAAVASAPGASKTAAPGAKPVAAKIAAPAKTGAAAKSAEQARPLRKTESELEKAKVAAKPATEKTLGKAEPRIAEATPARPVKTERIARGASASPAEVESKVADARSKTAEPAPETAAARKLDTTATASIPPAGETKTVASDEGKPEFRWPARGRIIQGFSSGGNDGINIAVPEGTQVKAAEGGVVAYAGNELKGYGNLVLIRHPNGFVSAYAHNGELDVKRGDQVKRGQTIAKSGQSGNVGSPQLHFELRKGSTPVDPTSYLAGL